MKSLVRCKKCHSREIKIFHNMETKKEHYVVCGDCNFGYSKVYHRDTVEEAVYDWEVRNISETRESYQNFIGANESMRGKRKKEVLIQ